VSPGDEAHLQRTLDGVLRQIAAAAAAAGGGAGVQWWRCLVQELCTSSTSADRCRARCCRFLLLRSLGSVNE
jgi:hypothetical protein